MNTQFKLVNAADYYQYDSQYHVYKDKTDDKQYMSNLIEKGEDLTIVGVVQPSEDATASMLMPGIYYPASLTEHVMKQAQSSDIVKQQLAHPDIDVFTGKKFGDESSQKLDMNSLFTIDTNMLKSAFQIDESQLQINNQSLDLSQIKIDPSSLPSFDVNSLLKDIHIQIDEQSIQKLSKNLVQHFQEYLKTQGNIDPAHIQEYFIAYLQLPETQKYISQQVSELLITNGLTEQFQKNIEAQLSSTIQNYVQTLTVSLQQEIASQLSTQMGEISKQFQKAFTIDENKLKQTFHMNMNEEELSELMMSLMTKETTSYDTNLKKLQYAVEEEPSSIGIYPKDFESKEEIIKILNQYNDQVQEEQVITYTDYVGTLMSSVTDIINVISYVLVAFVAISLVVSSIMIGVITYISVLERKKEIGILRAIGASKQNVSQVFNAETFIIGLLAGLMGIIITLLLLIPSNMVIHQIAGTTAVSAQLPMSGGITLVVISVLLTMIGGIIPSRKAAKEDPVTALRTE